MAHELRVHVGQDAVEIEGNAQRHGSSSTTDRRSHLGSLPLWHAVGDLASECQVLILAKGHLRGAARVIDVETEPQVLPHVKTGSGAVGVHLVGSIAYVDLRIGPVAIGEV